MTKRLPRPAAAAVLAFLLLALLVPASGAAGTPSVQSTSPTLLGGVNIVGLGYSSTPAQADRTIHWARALHAKLVRVELPWSVFEAPGPGRIDQNALAYTDRLLSDATADGIRVIMIADSTPCWASSAPAPLLRTCQSGQSSEANAWPPSHPGDYAAFVAYLARRYGTHLAAIEIWNEPDQINQEYFAGPEKPQRYAAILRAAYPAIKAANREVPVLAGSLVGSNGVFLRALYAAGIKGYYDGLAVHFYNLPLASLRVFREVQLENGDHAPLWLDEFGWSSCYPQEKLWEEQACVTPQIQARNIADLFYALQRTSYVAAAVVYDLQNAGGEQFGVLNQSGTHKPSFSFLAHALLSQFGLVSNVRLNLRVRGRRVIASGSGPVGDYLELDAFQGKVLRYTAFFTLDRFNRYSLALPSVLGTKRLRVRVFQYWTGPAKDAVKSI
jgi:polysaccharide biosynthesis protein PslG